MMLSSSFGTAAGEMLHAAEPFLERHLHPTVIIRGFVKALEDALAVVDELAFPIDIHDREQMLKIIASCIGTKFTSRFGTLMPVSVSNFSQHLLGPHASPEISLAGPCSPSADPGTGAYSRQHLQEHSSIHWL